MLLRLLTVSGMTLSALLSVTCARAQEAPGAAQAQVQERDPEPEPERIVVSAQRPGPGLWKVSKDGHVLWVFATYSPLPEKMQWRSQQVESVLGQSQQYLEPPGASTSVGFFRGLTLLPSVIGLKKNPDGATLHDVLPADVYARWQPLKARYLGDDDGIERERPIFAADALFQAGLKHAGLGKGYEVERKISAMVKQHKLESVKTRIDLEMDNPAQVMSDFKKSSLADVDCFSRTLSRLESDIDAMRVRASAWSKGDLEGIEKLSFEDQESACGDAMRNAEFTRKHAGLQNVKARIQAAWIVAAEKALSANASTFATLRLADVLRPDGYLAVLQSKGYLVERPD